MYHITLNNGERLPNIGLGTFLLPPDDTERSVEFALKNGYKLIDTANSYVNEKAVGRAMKNSEVPRENIYLETKLWPTFYTDYEAIDKTLERLDTDYVDLMLLHQPAGNYIEGYKMMEKAYKKGKIRSLGISNFSINEIRRLLSETSIVPSVIQVEAHPYCQQTGLREYLKRYNIALQSWYPLGGKGNGSLMNEEIIKELAAKYVKTPAQIILKWHTQMGFATIPGSGNEQHIKENISIFDFELKADDMNAISLLNRERPFFVRDDLMLEKFAKWCPDVEGQR